MVTTTSSSSRHPVVLVFADYYLPGYKGGGALRSLANLVGWLGDEFEFRIVTRDRDIGDVERYPDIISDGWMKAGKAYVRYIPKGFMSLPAVVGTLKEKDYDFICFNSLFSLRYTLCPLILIRLGFLRASQYILAPRGELGEGAFALKQRRKRLYLSFANLMGLFRGFIWHASTRHEERDIRQWVPSADIRVAGDLSSPVMNHVIENVREVKRTGVLKVVFLSRIAKVKNLHVALQLVRDLRGEVYFDIYGPLEDIEYWKKCQVLMENLGKNIRVSYRGSIEHNRVADILSTYHLFFLPSSGENFGHVILEALLCECMIMISDRTPWRDLEMKKVGWDLPLEETEQFVDALQLCIDMNETTFREYSGNAKKLGLSSIDSKIELEKNRNIFLKNN